MIFDLCDTGNMRRGKDLAVLWPGLWVRTVGCHPHRLQGQGRGLAAHTGLKGCGDRRPLRPVWVATHGFDFKGYWAQCAHQ